MKDVRFARSGARALTVCCALLLLFLTACNSSPEAKEAKFLKRGQALMEKKDYNRAQLEFRSAAQAMPKDAEPYYQQALAYLATSNLNAAIPALRKAIELNPKHSGAQLKLAELMTASRSKDMIEDAATKLRGVLATSPDNAEATDTLAIAEFRLGQTEDATKLLEAALAKFPQHLQSSVALARLKIAQGDLNGAEEILTKAAANAPKSSDAALALGRFYMLRNQPDKAEAEIRTALKLDPNNSNALASLGALQIAAKRMDEADQTYKQLAALPDKAFQPVHAIFLYRTGKKDLALAEFEKLAKQNPDDRAARSRLVTAYLEMNKFDQARNLLAAALKRNSKDTDALFQKSQLDLRSGKLADADEDLKAVLRVQPDSAEAHFALAGVYRAEKLPEMTKQELDAALREKPEMLAARLELARNYLVANQPKSALGLFDQMPPSQKGALAVVVERNWALLESGDTAEVRKILDQALKVRRAPELVLQDAVLLFGQKNYEGARQDAEEVLKSAPDDIRAVRMLLDTYVAQQNIPKGLERLSEIAAARPKSAALQEMLGTAYMNTGKLPEARKAFEQAKLADPKFVAADLSLAEIDVRENRPDAARTRLNGVLAADPKNVPALLRLASIEESAGNRESAIARYRAVLDVDNSNIYALNNLAYSLAIKDPAEALKYAQKATEIAPDSPVVQDTIGWVYYREGNYSAAVNYLKTAVDKDPTPRRQFHLAMSYLKSGERDLGQKMLDAALRKDPNLPKTEQGW